MGGNQCKTKENIHNNKRKLKITWEKKINYNKYTNSKAPNSKWMN